MNTEDAVTHLTNLLLDTTRPEQMAALSVAIDVLAEKARVERRDKILDTVFFPECPKTKFPDGTRCGDYDFHAKNCPKAFRDE